MGAAGVCAAKAASPCEQRNRNSNSDLVIHCSAAPRYAHLQKPAPSDALPAVPQWAMKRHRSLGIGGLLSAAPSALVFFDCIEDWSELLHDRRAALWRYFYGFTSMDAPPRMKLIPKPGG